jgi:putative membrane protein
VTIDPRSARAFLLIAWSGFLLWLWGSGEVARYLGPRSSWVVPVGAVALALVTAAYCRENGRRRRADARISLSEALGLGALLLPIVAGALLANAQLGALAASKKLSQRGIDLTALADLAAGNASHPDFVQINVAGHNAGFAKRTGLSAGRTVRLTGFVSRSGRASGDRFQLARFYITCCVADAVPIAVPVDPATAGRGRYRKDDWLDVTASLAHRGNAYVLEARKISRVKAPHDPYLSFSS